MLVFIDIYYSNLLSDLYLSVDECLRQQLGDSCYWKTRRYRIFIPRRDVLALRWGPIDSLLEYCSGEQNLSNVYLKRFWKKGMCFRAFPCAIGGLALWNIELGQDRAIPQRRA